MPLLAILRPMPLAFLILPFTYAMQVVGQNPLWGVIPYVLILLSVVATAYPLPRIAVTERLNEIDMVVALFVVLSSFHIALSLVTGNTSGTEAAKYFFMYVVTGWIYVYITRIASDTQIRAILIAIAISSVVIGVHWVVDTYSKNVLRETSWFALQSFQYVLERNQFSPDQVNTSILGTQYRAYGLADRYTTTGAIVAIGAYAALALSPAAGFLRKFLTLGVFLLILTIGMATTAWLNFLLLLPLALMLSQQLRNWWGTLGKVVALLVVFCLVGIMALFVFSSALLDRIFSILYTQATYIVNVDGTVAPISWLDIYWGTWKAYVDYIAAHPIYLLVGEGFIGYDGSLLARGGDVALFEFLATFGLPASVYGMLVLFLAAHNGMSRIRRGELVNAQAQQVMFGICAVFFVVFSLVHYNTLFNKAVFVFIYLGLGLIARNLYAPGLVRESAAPQEIRAT